MVTLSSLFSLLFGLFYASNARQQLEEKSRSVSDLLAMNVVAPLDFEALLGGTGEQSEDGNRILKTAKNDPDFVYAVVYRADSTVFARNGEVPPKAVAWAKSSGESRIIDDADFVHIAKKIAKNKKTLGILFVGFSKVRYNLAISTIVKRAILVSLVLSTLFIAMFYMLIMKTAVRPILIITEAVKRLGRGDLRPLQRGIETSTSELVEMYDALSLASDAFRASVKNIAEVASELSLTSEQILGNANDLSVAVSQQATAVNETTVTIEEVERTGHLTSENARNIQSIADQTQQISREGMVAVDDTRAQLDDIREQVAHIVQSSRNLNAELEEVDRIIASVAGVTQQSQTLAINASIEAAKAGNAGRGFRVVANKIRDLSQQSREATEQVRKTLTGVQLAIANIVVTNEKGLAYTQRGVASAERTRDVIRRLGDSIKTSTSAARVIAENTFQQATGLEQTSRAMAEINVASRKNTAGIEVVQQSGKQLQDRAQSLEKAVSRFITD